MQPSYHIYPLSETAATIAFEAVISEAVNQQVLALYHHLCSLNTKGVRDIVPAYHSLTLVYDLAALKKENIFVFDAIKQLLEAAVATCGWPLTYATETPPTVADHLINSIEIPVCYHPSLGLDIEELAAANKLTAAEVAAIHAHKQYRVFCIGFLPGFAYMGKVDERISAPRRAQPRPLLGKGSVGIAGEQTGIYPLASPGGWNIIGQTPLPLFDAQKALPVLLKHGDKVTFKAIGLEEFYVLKSLMSKTMKPVPTIAHGIKILKQGIADTIQDLGRFGHQHLGINPTGAMDMVAAQIANFLVGNNAGEAVVELHFPASTFLFQSSAIIALAGADFGASVDGKSIGTHKPYIVSKSAVLQFTKNKSGARCYLAIKGGVDVQPWLNSYSTNLKANAGGYLGRPLQLNDTIGFKQQIDFSPLLNHKNLIGLPWQAAPKYFYTPDNTIRCVAANECVLLAESSIENLHRSAFEITAQSDRMGYRLQGPPLHLPTGFSLISTAVTRGTVQLLPNGQLIVLMADHQTMGGYPRIAHVVQTDIPKLAQVQPHQHIQFQFITLEAAEGLWLQQQQYLRQLQNACTFKLNAYLQHEKD